MHNPSFHVDRIGFVFLLYNHNDHLKSAAEASGKGNHMLADPTLHMIFSILLMPFNLYCSFWIFQEVLKLAGITFREFLSRTTHVSFGDGREGIRRRQRFLFRFFAEISPEPEKSRKILNVYGISTCPGLAAMILAAYGAASRHPNKVTHVVIGNLILVLVNLGLLAARRIYKRKHPPDERTAEIPEAKKTEERRKFRVKDIIVYTIVGALFLTVLVGFHLGLAGVVANMQPTQNTEQTTPPKKIAFDDVNTILRNRGFETANIPTTCWFYDENKLANVTAGIKGDTRFEFYEYTDGETTGEVYNRISCDIAQDMEFKERSEHETALPHGGKLFTVTQNGVSSFVLCQNNTVVYAYSPEYANEIHDILSEIGYVS